ncbi:hypothetical protein [Marinomonas epiphytica]
MRDNLIPFPSIERRSKHKDKEVALEEVAQLRDKFDQARERWPIELAELPENNKRLNIAKK